jgi:hypothetical protein
MPLPELTSRSGCQVHTLRGESGSVRVGHTATDTAVKDAIEMAVATPESGFGLRLRGVHPLFVAVAYDTLGNGQNYDVVPLPRPATAAAATAGAGRPAVGGGPRSDCTEDARGGEAGGVDRDAGAVGILSPSGVTLSPKKARLPTVIVACLGTGR